MEYKTGKACKAWLGLFGQDGQRVVVSCWEIMARIKDRLSLEPFFCGGRYDEDNRIGTVMKHWKWGLTHLTLHLNHYYPLLNRCCLISNGALNCLP